LRECVKKAARRAAQNQTNGISATQKVSVAKVLTFTPGAVQGISAPRRRRPFAATSTEFPSKIPPCAVTHARPLLKCQQNNITPPEDCKEISLIKKFFLPLIWFDIAILL